MPLLESDGAIERLLTTSKTIAIVGLSDKPYRDSHEVATYLQRMGYRIIPVNPNAASVLGLKSHPTLEDFEEQIDIVDIFRRPEHVPAIVEAAIAIKAKAVWMQLGVMHQAAAMRASSAGLNVVMDRCILVEHRRLAA